MASISLREALGTPESVRTATHDRSTLGSRVLSHPLSLTDALGRLTLSPLTRVGMPRIASLREMLATAARAVYSIVLCPVWLSGLAGACARSGRASDPTKPVLAGRSALADRPLAA